MVKEAQGRWLLLIHQIPPKPNYLRVKVWRRLQRLGAVAIKNSVDALPVGEAALEDLQWVARESTDGGGEATVCEARLLEGLTDETVEALFQAARDADCAQIAQEARGLENATAAGQGDAPSVLASGVVKLRRRLVEVAEIDFFSAPGREAAEGLVTALELRLAQLAGPVKVQAEVAALIVRGHLARAAHHLLHLRGLLVPLVILGAALVGVVERLLLP